MTNSRVIACCAALCAAGSGVASGDDLGPPVPTTGPTWRVTLKLDWTLFFSPGAGGSVSADFDHHEVTAMGLATKLPPLFRDMLLSGARSTDALVNLGAELGYSYFLRPDRHWWFVGGLVSYDQYRSDGRAALSVWYAVPRVGARVPLGKRLFVEPSIGVALRMHSSGPAGGLDARTAAPVLLLPLGMEW